MEPGNAQNVRHDSPSAEIPTVDFERAAGVEQSPSQVPALPPPHPTTYCYRHNSLETVDGVEKVRPFIVEERGLFWPAKTNRSACEVWGFTTAGCSVHFIGGPEMERLGDPESTTTDDPVCRWCGWYVLEHEGQDHEYEEGDWPGPELKWPES